MQVCYNSRKGGGMMEEYEVPEFKSKLDARSERERLEYLLKLLKNGNTAEAIEIIEVRIKTLTESLEES